MAVEGGLQGRILQALDQNGGIEDIGSYLNIKEVASVQSAVTSLASLQMLTFEKSERDLYRPSAEGQQIVEQGSHEAIVFAAIAAKMEGLSIDELTTAVGRDVAKVGQGRAFKLKWIKKNDSGGFEKNVDTIEDDTQRLLKEIEQRGVLDNKAQLTELLKRKLVQKDKQHIYSVQKGPEFALEVRKLQTELTLGMIHSGEWKNAKFKPYNFNSLGIAPSHGALHPLLKVRSEFRQIFFEMGFTEMPTNQFVETSFWNFDALFVPQQHPARDLQDTFYIKDPAIAASISPSDITYAENAQAVHENGKFGSIGYRYKYSREESQKLVLRTHTTAISAAQLYKLAQAAAASGQRFVPTRLFSIDRVFRNETVDATHLAEFHQIEGVIADYNLTLGDLIGFMQIFFGKLGVSNLRFKPAYNPYTEPSLEIFSYHDGLKKWVEIGNSGIFRPEMLESMGLPPDLRVHGFGLSLERPTMIKYGLDNIRDLVGHKIDINGVEASASVRLDKAMKKELIVTSPMPTTAEGIDK